MSAERNRPKVSVIIPVYNAAAYLGYCLNSVLSQTWTDFEAVVVNDGSTDQSLEICERFEQNDSRFRIISIPNGGVSNARNTAVAAAGGEYFVFLDSDDYLALDALERMIQAEEVHHTGLVVGDVQTVDLSRGEVLPTRLSADYTGEKSLFSKEEFRSCRMELIWHTSMMEGLYGKLYSAKIWRKSGTLCPPDMTLGEDFVANMNYYRACDGVVFLKRPTYYYNCIATSDSITHKFRPDLFDIKMSLMEELQAHLGGLEHMCPYERRCYCEYVASTGLVCIEKIRAENVRLTEDEKFIILSNILNHPRFRQCMGEAKYFDGRFYPLLPLIQAGNVKGLLGIPLPEEAVPKDTQKASQASASDTPQGRRHFLNRVIGKAARTAAGMCGNRPLAGKLLRFDESLRAVGIKITLRQHSRKARRKNDAINDQRAMLQSVLDERQAGVLSRLEAVREDIQGSLWVIKERQSVLARTENLAKLEKTLDELQIIQQGEREQIEAVQEERDQIQASLTEARKQQKRLIDAQTEELKALQLFMRELETIQQENLEQSRHTLQEAKDHQIMIAQKQTDDVKALQRYIEELQDMHKEARAQQENRNEALQGCSKEIQRSLENMQEVLHSNRSMVEASTQSVLENVRAALQSNKSLVEASTQDVKDQIYLGESRITAKFQRDRVNGLRQQKKILLISTAEHANIGDAAITLADQYLLRQQYPDYFQMEFSTYEMDRQYSFLQAIMNPEDILFIHGGGNLGSLYREEEDLHRRIVTDFPNHPVVILPQTIFFSDDEHGRRELALSESVYNRHPNLTIFTRGRESHAFASEHFPNARVFLMPDTSLILRRNYTFERDGVLLCLRDDGEGIFDEAQTSWIQTMISETGSPVDKVSNIAEEDIPREMRAEVVNGQLKRFARHRAVVTDRLHGVLFAVITNTPCVALDIGNQKIREFVETFLQDSNAVFFIGNDLDKLPEAVRKALSVEEPAFPILSRRPLESIRHMAGE